MVGPGEVDEELQPEVVEECAKYGEVVKVIIYEVSIFVISNQHVISPYSIIIENTVDENKENH